MFRILVMNFSCTRLSVKMDGITAQPFLRGFRAASGRHGTFHNKFP